MTVESGSLHKAKSSLRAVSNKKQNAVAFNPQANYTDGQPPLFGEF
jgi:hypothetical protein